ncbi:L,D-transpeptidase [Pseudanabaena sp. FACHB-1998]|nr:L,D-transpeptidase [Pseudanabaena sp. FACHB-1998]
MFKYCPAKLRASALLLFLSLFLIGVSDSLTTDMAIAQTSRRSNSARDRDIELLRRSGQRWIEIRLRSQRLLAWQGNQLVYAVVVSTGKSATPTPKGIFKIQTKYPTARMQGEDYNVPDVPNVMYYSGNYAIHGAYWHRSFGIPISHGCTNVAPDHAAWLYRWASVGTTVVVR